MAAIRKRNDRWQVQVRRKGFSSITRSFQIKADAMEWSREIERQIDRDELAIDRRQLESLQLGDLVRRYRDNVVPSKKGYEAETIVLNAFLREPICKMSCSPSLGQYLA